VAGAHGVQDQSGGMRKLDVVAQGKPSALL
jgi:hypothetical protein